MSAATSMESRIQRALAGLEAERSTGSECGVRLLAAQHRVAHAFRAARRFDEAIDRFADTVEKSVEWHGPNHPETLRYRSSLANCRYAAGHTDQAIGMFRELYEARLAVLGEEHPDTMRSRGSLANALNTAGRMHEAEGLHRRNVEDRETVLGAEHPSTQASRRNLERTAGNSGGYCPDADDAGWVRDAQG